MAEAMEEDKVTYEENGKVRVLRGTIIDENENFLVISRRDGNIEISKKIILKIERRGGKRL